MSQDSRKSIIIIGAGPGIGQAVARQFGHNGWIVVLVGRNAARLDGLITELTAAGIVARRIVADATDPVALRSAIADADGMTGGLAVVHFNAAVVRQQDLFSMSDDEVINDLAINVAGGLHTIRAAVSLFGKRGGTILVTGGGLGVSPHDGYASLGAGKAALRNIVQARAEPLSARAIRIATASVSTLVSPNSAEAEGVADTFWELAANSTSGWKAVYPANSPDFSTNKGILT